MLGEAAPAKAPADLIKDGALAGAASPSMNPPRPA